MANSDAPQGFRPLNRDGSPYNGGTLRCVIPSGDTTAVFIGDAVELAGSSDTGYPSVNQCAAGDPVFGVVTAFEANPDDLGAQYRKASTERFCQVAPAESTYFEVQEDAVGGALAATDVGLNANFVVGSGDTTYGRSGMELDSSSAATTATLDCQIVGFIDREDNEIGSANAKVLIRFNDPQQAPGRTGV